MAKKYKILVAEDDRLLARALELKLTGSGYETTVVNDGQAALNQIQSNTFDLIILDLVMPILDGFHVLQKLKEINPQTPVIILSNLGQDEDIKKAKAMGAVDFFIKSRTPLAKIVEIIQQALK